MSRVAGRHVLGGPVGEVRPGCWDEREKAVAAQIDQLEPGWLVMYGVWSRRFFAIAAWSGVPLMIEARDAEDLRHQMREAELDAMPSSGSGQPRAA
ncbi:hypothetical protein AB0M95_08445 [Sphaerisporangium sp. NPDC051017]|uniref:hypothetical protein n=1 Tax=Sphaerisporangium sp. NPDC051017 TaxID=3154636 RepID=UPI0034412965